MAIQFVMFSWGEMIGACILLLTVGAYLYAIAMSKCIEKSLNAVNHNARAETDQSILLKQLIEFLESHSNTKQLSIK